MLEMRIQKGNAILHGIWSFLLDLNCLVEIVSKMLSSTDTCLKFQIVSRHYSAASIGFCAEVSEGLEAALNCGRMDGL